MFELFAITHASWRFWRCGNVAFGSFGGFNLGGGWVPQTKPVPLLVPVDPRTTSGSLSKEA